MRVGRALTFSRKFLGTNQLGVQRVAKGLAFGIENHGEVGGLMILCVIARPDLIIRIIRP